MTGKECRERKGEKQLKRMVINHRIRRKEKDKPGMGNRNRRQEERVRRKTAEENKGREEDSKSGVGGRRKFRFSRNKKVCKRWTVMGGV